MILFLVKEEMGLKLEVDKLYFEKKRIEFG